MTVPDNGDPSPISVVALYRFQRIDPDATRGPLLSLCDERGIRGTLILAREGINGTVAGTDAAIGALLAHLVEAGLGGLEPKFSRASEMPFRRLKIRVKREIVTMGVPDIDPPRDAGAYVDAAEWNALVADPGTILVDTRNDYEVALGTFEGAVDPGTRTFREFPAWVAANRDRLAGRRVAMFCTGGIRCEKATAYVRSLGIGEVHHLRGGILKYLEEVDPADSLWRGECFVFDERVSVGHGLEPGEAALCRACRRPVTPAAMRDAAFVPGVSCPACVGERSADDRARFAERQRQVEHAERGGRPPHLGPRVREGDGASL